MTRFREEVYNAPWFKELVKQVQTAEKRAELLSWKESEGSQPVRVEYFAKSHKRHRAGLKAHPPAWRRLDA